MCGEDVPPRALACPECGADERSGWREGALDEDDLPDDDFDYDRFVEEEFGGGATRRPNLLWWITAVVLLIAFALWALSGAF